MEPKTPEEIAKKLWHIARVVFFMLRRGISKSRIAVDLGLLAKRGNKLAGKAIANFLTFNGLGFLFGCRSNGAVSFVSPREYEFSCSNSPAALSSFYPFHKRRKAAPKYDDATTVAAVQRMLEMLNHSEASAAASPMMPGFGRSPATVRQLRITDSPFPVKDVGGDGGQVDRAADEFIKRFYKDLKSEKATAAMDQSPSPYHSLWAR
ncbi:unnamed protein product [Linum tenue]|uniref:Avr9/Cf-9 rapidly elicited protein 146 n=1 Tax=Linum tenue TaxID=586396 RepID=A0AAV0QH03_9ROSI|nr:unnamed protein product [Linum tenue]